MVTILNEVQAAGSPRGIVSHSQITISEMDDNQSTSIVQGAGTGVFCEIGHPKVYVAVHSHCISCYIFENF